MSVDGHGTQADPRLEGDRDRLVDARERLDREAQRHVVAALAPDLLGERQAEEPELAHLRDDVHRQFVRSVGLVGLRRDDGVGELADHVVQLLFLVGQVVHGAPHSWSDAFATAPS